MNNSLRTCLAISFILSLFVMVQNPHEAGAESYKHAAQWCDNKAKNFARKHSLNDMYSKLGETRELGFHRALGNKSNIRNRGVFSNIANGRRQDTSVQGLYNLQYKICMVKHRYD